MDWIKENKFLSSLIGATVLFAGGIIYFAYINGSAFAEKMDEYGNLKTSYQKLVSAKPYPDNANLMARRENIIQYETVISDLRKALGAYQPGALTQLTPGEFSDVQLKMQGKLRAAFEKAGTSLPDKCGFGFEKYATIQAKPGATKSLNYQLGAIEWLLVKLAETRPQELVNLRREQLDVERGVVAPPVPQPTGGRGGRRQAAQLATPVEEKLFEVMPMELVFTAREPAVREFLKEMANSKEYFYAIRAIRIRSTKQTPPTVKDADFRAEPGPRNEAAVPFAENNPFEGFVLPGEEGGQNQDPAEVIAPAPALEPTPLGEQILKQVLGSEKLNVHICFDILLIKDDIIASTGNSPSSPGGSQSP